MFCFLIQIMIFFICEYVVEFFLKIEPANK